MLSNKYFYVLIKYYKNSYDYIIKSASYSDNVYIKYIVITIIEDTLVRICSLDGNILVNISLFEWLPATKNGTKFKNENN